jgi:hypothetical protein
MCFPTPFRSILILEEELEMDAWLWLRSQCWFSSFVWVAQCERKDRYRAPILVAIKRVWCNHPVS